jgi:hypothetical protein
VKVEYGIGYMHMLSVRPHLGDLDEEHEWPPFQTAKEIRRLTNDELADITAWEQIFFDWYAENDNPDDPVTRELFENLRRLYAEIDRRIEAGTLRQEDLCAEDVVNPKFIYKKSAKRESRFDSFLNHGTLICGAIGTILGSFLSSTPGIMGALNGALLGAFVPTLIVSLVAMFNLFAFLLSRIARPL